MGAKVYFLWQQPTHDLQSRKVVKMLKDLSEGDVCKKELAGSIMEPLCSQPNTTAEKEGCTQAMQAYLQADTCAGNKVDDIIKCHKVCGYGAKGSDPETDPPKLRLARSISLIRFGCICFLGFIVVCRSVRILRDVYHTSTVMDEELDGEKATSSFYLKKLLVICWCLDPMDLKEEDSETEHDEDTEALMS